MTRLELLQQRDVFLVPNRQGKLEPLAEKDGYIFKPLVVRNGDSYETHMQPQDATSSSGIRALNGLIVRLDLSNQYTRPIFDDDKATYWIRVGGHSVTHTRNLMRKEWREAVG